MRAKNGKTDLALLDVPTTRENTRKQLLHAIKRLRPDVLSSLAADVLPLYRKFYRPDVRQYHLMHWWQLRDANDQKWNRLRAASGGEVFPLFHLERALWRWADTYNLKEDWFLDYALQTLRLWCQQGTHEERDWAYSLEGPRYTVVDVPSKFHFEYDPWDPKVDTWKSYKRRLNDSFVSAVDAYSEAITAALLAEKKKIARQTYEEAHYKWIIDCQIPLNKKTKSKSEIAHHASTSGGVDLKTVDEAIKTIAHVVGWTLRPPKRGRPRKPRPPSG